MPLHGHAVAPGRIETLHRRTLVAWVMRPAEKVTPRQATKIAQIMDAIPALALAITLAQTFATIVRQQNESAFTGWLEQMRNSGLPPFRRVATSFQQDELAIRAALTLPWSNGPVEGTINRLKLLKRQMYGRAKLDLLRQRLMAS